MSRIFIVGAGVVGAATGRALLRSGHRVTFVDIAPARIAALTAEGLDARPVLDLDGEPESLVFLCLPIAADREGYRLGAIEAGALAVGRAMAAADVRHTVVVRSAVPPGTTEDLIRPLIETHSGKREGVGFALAVSPQLASTAAADAFAERADSSNNSDNSDAAEVPAVPLPRVAVIGARSRRVAAQVREVVEPVSDGVKMVDDPASAELIRCVASLANATKISFWNEIWQVCQLLDLDADQVAEAVAATAAASIDPEYGIRGGAPYGGQLPAETRGFLEYAAGLGLPMPLLSAVVGINTEFEWRMAAELDGDALSAIPRSRGSRSSGGDLDDRPRTGRFDPDKAFRPETDAPPLPRRPRPSLSPRAAIARIPRQRP